MEEVRREHHVVTRVPEFGVILSVEEENVTGSDETEAGYNHASTEEVNKES